jgi:fused signal recognition particle receptor
MGDRAIWLADVAPEPGGWPVLLLIALLVLGVVAFLVHRARTRGLPGEQRVRLDGEGRRALPGRDERAVVDAPVEITEEMSLREIRAAKQARLATSAQREDAIEREKERRRGTGRTTRSHAVLPTDADDEASAPQDATLASEPEETRATEAASAGATDDAAETAAAPDDRAIKTDADGATTVDGGAEPREKPGSSDSTVPDATSAPPPADAAASESRTHEPAPRTDGDAPASPLATRPTADAIATRGLNEGLAKTRMGFVARLGAIFARPRLDDDALEELEEILFTADIGVRTSEHLLQIVQRRIAHDAEVSPEVVWETLRAEVVRILESPKGTLRESLRQRPAVLLMVGVNGAGKTTTIGKLAAAFADQGKRVLLVAGDTFRAAAVDQLAEWGARTGAEVFRAAEGADPSGVVFDGLQKAEREGFDVVLCDTAGRLQNRRPLMDELEKILRVANKAIPGAPHESILVVDANTGQNALEQAKQFGAVAQLTGVVLTKLDGTAKGGVVIGISHEFGLPIHFVGIGEAVEDLRRFDAREFAEALF